MVEKDIRKEIIKGTIEEFRGPRFGHDEIISYDPWEEYLISTVIPSSWKRKSTDISPDEEDIDESVFVSIKKIARSVTIYAVFLYFLAENKTPPK